MRNRALWVSGLVVLGLVAGVFVAQGRADDPWKDKPYTQWDEKDLEKVLNESPWVKRVHVRATWPAPRAGKNAGGPPDGAAKGGRGTGLPGASTEQQSVGGRSPFGDELPPERRALFLIRWSSARTIREGMARLRMLRGELSEADAERLINEGLGEEYVVVIYGEMVPFKGLEEAQLKEVTYIKPGSSGKQVAPSRVDIQKTADGKNIVAIAFHFPQKGEDGEGVVATDEKNIDFLVMAGKTKIETRFDARKMAGFRGRDL